MNSLAPRRSGFLILAAILLELVLLSSSGRSLIFTAPPWEGMNPDDNREIELAIAMATVAPDHTVHLQPRSYVITRPIQMPLNNVTILGAASVGQSLVSDPSITPAYSMLAALDAEYRRKMGHDPHPGLMGP